MWMKLSWIRSSTTSGSTPTACRAKNKVEQKGFRQKGDCAQCQLPVDRTLCHFVERCRQSGARNGKFGQRCRRLRVRNPQEDDRRRHHFADGDAAQQYVFDGNPAGHALVLQQGEKAQRRNPVHRREEYLYAGGPCPPQIQRGADGIITRLYEGDSDAFWALVKEYKSAGKQEQADWLLECWPEGKYRDVIGLCKVAKLDGEDGIIDQDYSLNAGRYVGVVIEDDGMTAEEFAETMKANYAELKALNAEAETLMAEIEKNMNELFE